MPEVLLRRLDALRALQSRDTLARWRGLVDAGEWPALVRELLEQHYDPLYRRSQERNFSGFQQPQVFTADDLSPPGIARLAAAIVHSRTAQMA